VNTNKDRMIVSDAQTPLLASAIEAAGEVVAAGVAKGLYSSYTTTEDYGKVIASMAGQIMRSLLVTDQ